jgi:hypothetical protein
MTKPEMSSDGRTLTVHVPLTFRKRSGRKLVIALQGAEAWAPPRPRIDNAMVKAIARAFRWRNLLETSTHTTVAEIAAVEKINASYVGRVLRLTMLSPEIVEAILDGRQPDAPPARGLAEAVLGRLGGAAGSNLGHFPLTTSQAEAPAEQCSILRLANRLGKEANCQCQAVFRSCHPAIPLTIVYFAIFVTNGAWRQGKRMTAWAAKAAVRGFGGGIGLIRAERRRRWPSMDVPSSRWRRGVIG